MQTNRRMNSKAAAMRCAAMGVLIVVLTPSLDAQFGKRGFVRGLGGVTLGGAETSAAGGLGGGLRLSRHLDVFAEAGAIGNVLPTEIQDFLDAELNLIAAIEGVPVKAEVRVPNQYGIAGFRVNLPTGSVVTPFLEAGGGAGRISFKLDRFEVLGVDLTPELREELRQEFGDLHETKLLVAAGGGISIAVHRRVGVDVGYRYHRIFTDDPSINTSLIYVGVIWRF